MNKKTIDRYEIKSELGHGGMATVFRAYDPRFKRDVALKVLDRRLLHDPSFHSRFEREAQVVAKIDHPRIVPIYDYGEDQGQAYLVMRLMEGGTLKNKIKNGRLSLPEIEQIFTRIGEALDSIHQQGIIHRDLKPDNILFDQYGQPCLADFGIVKMVGSNATLTGTSLVGTPGYMSPEQVKGHRGIDGRSDIYSLGVIFFELLTGKRPYRADTAMRTAMKHVLEPVPSIMVVMPDLPLGCETIIQRSMSKEPENRYASVADFVADIANVHHLEAPKPPEEIKPARISEPAVTATATRSWNWKMVLGIMAVFILIIGLGTQLLPAKNSTEDDLMATTNAAALSAPTTTPPMAISGITDVNPVATTAVIIATASSPTATMLPSPTHTPASTPEPEAQRITSQNVSKLTPLSRLKGQQGTLNWTAVSPDEQFLAIANSLGLDIHQLSDWTIIQSLPDYQNGLHAVWSPDDQQLAVITSNQDVVILDTASWNETTQLTGITAVTLAWSPDSTQLLVGDSKGVISLWPITETGIQQLWDDHSEPITQIVWSPNGVRFASASGDDTIQIYRTDDTSRQTIYSHAGGVWSLDWSPDGTQIVTGGADDTIRVWDVETGRTLRTFVGHKQDVTHVVWFTEDDIMSGDEDGTIRLWSLATQDENQRLQRHANVRQLIWMPDHGQFLSVGERDQTIQLWDAVTLQDKQIQTGFMSESVVVEISWSPDSKQLAVGGDDGPVRIWSIEDVGVTAVLAGHEDSITSVAWSPNGQLVATGGSSDNTVRVWNVHTGELVITLGDEENTTNFITAVSWSSDSTQLASGDSGDNIEVWDVVTGESTTGFRSSAGFVFDIGWSPDDTQLAIAGEDGRIMLWDFTASYAPQILTEHDKTVAALAWSNDGTQLASAGGLDGNILIWNAADWDEPPRIIADNSSIHSIAWSPNDEMLTTSQGDKTTRIWQVEDEAELHTLPTHASNGNALWSPDGKYFASSDEDGVVSVWHILDSESP